MDLPGPVQDHGQTGGGASCTRTSLTGLWRFGRGGGTGDGGGEGGGNVPGDGWGDGEAQEVLHLDEAEVEAALLGGGVPGGQVGGPPCRWP